MPSSTTDTGLRIQRILPATPERAFDAWTSAEAIRVWMCPGDIFESPARIDLRVGGSFEITMRSPGLDDVHRGEYREIDRPHRLSFTWISNSTHQQPTLVTLEFRPHGDGECELTLSHEQLPPDEVDGHFIGWKAHVRSLVEHLEAAGAGPS